MDELEGRIIKLEVEVAKQCVELKGVKNDMGTIEKSIEKINETLKDATKTVIGGMGVIVMFLLGIIVSIFVNI